MYGYSKKRPTKEADAFQKTLAEPIRKISGLTMILAGAALGLLILIAVLWVFAGRGERQEAGVWKEYYAAHEERDPARRLERMEKLAGDASDSSVRPVAMLGAAVLRHEGALDLPPDKKSQRDEDLRKAADLLEKLLAEYPRHQFSIQARERLGMVLEDSGRPAEALKAFEAARAQAVGTDFAFMAGRLLYCQARCKVKLGDKASGAELLEQALRRDAALGDRQRDNASGDRGWRMAAEGLLASIRPPARKDLRVSGAARDGAPEPEKPAPPAEPRPDGAPAGEAPKPAGAGTGSPAGAESPKKPGGA